MNVHKYPFFEVFRENPDGSLSPKRSIIINGITVTENVTFSAGAIFGGIDFHKYKNQSIAGEEKDGMLIIHGFYKN